MKFRKKPVVVDAIQWNGNNFDELRKWGAPVVHPAIGSPIDGDSLVVTTLEDGPIISNGEHTAIHVASLNDWIVRGVAGEFYAVKPDIFAQTYEPENELRVWYARWAATQEGFMPRKDWHIDMLRDFAEEHKPKERDLDEGHPFGNAY